MTTDEQLDLWVEGNPQHNYDSDECCPDFSCCQPKLLAPKEVREVFSAACRSNNEAVKMRMLMVFLRKAAEVLDKDIYIAGEDASHQEIE